MTRAAIKHVRAGAASWPPIARARSGVVLARITGVPHGAKGAQKSGCPGQCPLPSTSLIVSDSVTA
jgi:hypothetical protein